MQAPCSSAESARGANTAPMKEEPGRWVEGGGIKGYVGIKRVMEKKVVLFRDSGFRDQLSENVST